MRLTLIVFLALSLAANVFLGGFVAGRVLGGPPHHGAHGGPPPGAGRLPIFSAAENLSPEGRKIFHETFKDGRAGLRGAFGDSLELRRAFGEALAAEPFDRAKAEAALATMQGADAENHRRVSALLIDAAEKMTPADRKVLVEAWRKPREFKRRGHGRDGPGERRGDPPAEAGEPEARPSEE